MLSWEEKDDAEILIAIAEGNHFAFAILVKRHSTRFYRIAYRYLKSRSAAEDLVQDALLKLWEKPNMWRAEKNTKFTTWFYRVIVNLSLDHLKKKRPIALPEGFDYADERPNHESSLMITEQQKMLENEIAKLPERQQTALNLCFYEGLSNQEAADIMDINLKALQSLLMRAKTGLKEKLITVS